MIYVRFTPESRRWEQRLPRGTVFARRAETGYERLDRVGVYLNDPHHFTSSLSPARLSYERRRKSITWLPGTSQGRAYIWMGTAR